MKPESSPENDRRRHPVFAASAEPTRIGNTAAASDACVLLQGESGTGKELAARAIHKYSSRCNGPFVAVNVASLSSTLAESELFGHVRGAFTGAEQARNGLLIKADHGTLFLDEVADIPIPTQVKLLRVLEDGEVLPVGGDETIHSDLRVISATHQDLLRLVHERKFRHDLYFRISTFQIDLPALRDRMADICVLAEYFANVLSRAPGGTCPQLSQEARKALEDREWHGNVRELRNAIEHAIIVARGGSILPDHFPSPMPATAIASNGLDIEGEIHALLTQWANARLQNPESTGQLYTQLLTLVEPAVLRAIVRSQGGQLASSARILGLHRTTLKKKLDEYGVS